MRWLNLILVNRQLRARSDSRCWTDPKRIGLIAILTLVSSLAVSVSAKAQDSPWTVEAGTLFLKKEGPDSTTLFVVPGTNTPVFNANAFDFNHEFGPAIRLIRNLDPYSGLELRF